MKKSNYTVFIAGRGDGRGRDSWTDGDLLQAWGQQMSVELRRARPRDIPRITELYEAARASLRDMGVDQWQNGYPDGSSALRDIHNGVCWVMVEDGRVVATAAGHGW